MRAIVATLVLLLASSGTLAHAQQRGSTAAARAALAARSSIRGTPGRPTTPLGRAALTRAASPTAFRGRPVASGRLRLTDAQRPTLYPGVARALGRMAVRGLSIGIVTNNSRDRANATNTRLGIAGFFRHILGARDRTGRQVNPPKPAPDMLLRLARELGVSPNEMVFVGDSPSDVEAGNRAGMITIALENGSATRAELDATRPTHVLSRFADVPALLDRLAREGHTIRGVGIDMDGTYVDSWVEYREAVRFAVRDIGIDVTRRELDQALSRRAFGSRHEDAGGLVPPDRQEAFRAAFNRRYVETLPR